MADSNSLKARLQEKDFIEELTDVPTAIAAEMPVGATTEIPVDTASTEAPVDAASTEASLDTASDAASTDAASAEPSVDATVTGKSGNEEEKPKFAVVVAAATPPVTTTGGAPTLNVNRSASAMARQRWGIVNKHVKRNTSTFFGINTELGGDHHMRWEHRRRRLASKRCGPLKPDGISRQESSASGTRPPGVPPPAFLAAVDAFATPSKSTKGDALPVAATHPRLQRYISDPLARQRLLRLQSSQSQRMFPEAYHRAASAFQSGAGTTQSDGAGSPPSLATTSASGFSAARGFGLKPKESVAKMAWAKLSEKAKPQAKPKQVPTARQVLEHARSFKPSSLVSTPIVPSDKAVGPSTADEDSVDGELFFDINITPGASFASRTPKSAKFEVGGKGSGGVWKVSDKTRSGPMGAFGKEDQEQLEKIEGRLDRYMDSALEPPPKRQLGMGVVGRLLNRTMRSQSRVASDIKQQLEDIDDHRPFFTYWATFVQILIMIITLAVYGFAPLGFERKHVTGTVQTTNLALQEVSYWEQQSFWLGPRSSDLIHLGAKYSPCMRRDEKIWTKVKRCRLKEKESGCCILNDGGGCVQKYERQDCSKTLAVFHKWTQASPSKDGRESGPVCGEDPEYCTKPPSVKPHVWADDITEWPVCIKPSVHEKAPSNAPEHMRCEVVGHPCCEGIKGQCRITTREHCEFLRGYYHDEATLCSQVSCLDDVCGMISFLDPEKPDQFYRLWTSLFLHGGLLHLIITIIFQYVVMRDLEKMGGPVRIGIIYIGSGIAGNLASCIFLPYQAEVGPSGSQFGLLACLFVEVLQSWPLLKHPWRALGKLVAILLFLFLLGLLPWVDNYSHLFGFIFGFLLSFTVLPYVSFGEFDRKRKITTILICLLCTIGMFAALIILFYVTPVYECTGCSYFNCIPFTEHFCENMEVGVKLEDCK